MERERETIELSLVCKYLYMIKDTCCRLGIPLALAIKD